MSALAPFDRKEFERFCDEQGLVVPDESSDPKVIGSLVSWYVLWKHEQESEA